MIVRRPVAVALFCATVAALSSVGRSEAPAALPEILVSRQLLETQHLRVGDVVALSSEPAGGDARQFKVVGQYEPTPDPMRLGAVRLEVRLHLPDLIDLDGRAADPLAAETVDAINVAMASPAESRTVARRLTSAIPGAITQRAGNDARRTAPFVVLERFHLAIAIVTVLASSVFLLALMLMLVDERRATVGILRLMGFRRARILQHVLAEGVAIAIAGAAFGIILSLVMQGGINRFFQWRYDTALVFVRITPNVALRSLAVAVPLGVAAIVASSWSLLRGDVFALTRR
ncbi:MAG TPA: FtsX-like permease family protein [Vicinamibacterales bacterium]|nr:FtsX-like permease family protein [Vicinamibacterales bacterium]